MNIGRVFVWVADPNHPLHGRVEARSVALQNLAEQGEGKGRLCGRFVRVRNASWIKERNTETGVLRCVPLGDAESDSNGDFRFQHGRGGARLDKVEWQQFQNRYIRAARFGEVNTYYHIDHLATHIHDLLMELGAPPLPRVIAVVNAHHAITEHQGIRDGVLKLSDRWLPFQGGHYRLRSRHYDIDEHEPVSPTGEIHLGAGWQLWEQGALAEFAGRRYRANASHNAGIIYHEYGHHITRHTADFRANTLRPPDNQDNRKAPIDEGTADYWAATMLGTPHIWAWHRPHTDQLVHPRSLVSAKSMIDFDHERTADPHVNGTIWGSALWDLRTQFSSSDSSGARKTDLLLLQALLLLGKVMGDENPPTPESVRVARSSYEAGVRALLRADEKLFAGAHRDVIVDVFARRGISAENRVQVNPASFSIPAEKESEPVRASLLQTRTELFESDPAMHGLLKHVSLDDIPETRDLLSGEGLEKRLKEFGYESLSLIAVGDIMLGGRASKYIKNFGSSYIFESVRPLFRRAPIGLANLEGPIAKEAEKLDRHYTYRVNPRTTRALLKAGINVVTLANNHLLDCGREGVLETLQTLLEAGVTPIGAGVNKEAAHSPAILVADQLRIGFLGYYWNRRTAARGPWPGSAMDTPPELLRADLETLKSKADRIVATFHWGVPYVREPSEADRSKARFAIDCGADIVIGHHPHIVQPFEIYRGRPIFYSVGNFAFGSGNSRGESLILGVRFEERKCVVEIYPAYVKNRDPRIHYQPKVLCGDAAERALRRLVEISGDWGEFLRIEDGRGVLELPMNDRGVAAPLPTEVRTRIPDVSQQTCAMD